MLPAWAASGGGSCTAASIADQIKGALQERRIGLLEAQGVAQSAPPATAEGAGSRARHSVILASPLLQPLLSSQ